ncbi:MAG: response regulator transcription factor [Bacteroidota bacterium]
MAVIKIIIVDDKLSIRESLSMLLEGVPDIEVIGMFENALHVNDSIKSLCPDLVLMDIDMPGINGIQAVANVRKAGNPIPIIMLTVFEDEERIFEAIRSGANGYLLKNINPQQIISAIRDVNKGGASFTPSVAKKVLNYFQSPIVKPKDYKLTNRERQVLAALVNGKAYKEIAEELHIGYETVRSHMKKIYAKIHVNSLTEAVAKTIREKIL